MRQAWKIFFENSGVSNHKLGEKRERSNPGGMCNAEYGIRDKNILGCAECAHFNQEVRDSKFEIYERNAGGSMTKITVNQGH